MEVARGDTGIGGAGQAVPRTDGLQGGGEEKEGSGNDVGQGPMTGRGAEAEI